MSERTSVYVRVFYLNDRSARRQDDYPPYDMLEFFAGRMAVTRAFAWYGFATYPYEIEYDNVLCQSVYFGTNSSLVSMTHVM